jgi:hypothetical protein
MNLAINNTKWHIYEVGAMGLGVVSSLLAPEACGDGLGEGQAC